MLSYLAPQNGTAIAEQLRDNGYDGLICYDDFSKHAKVYRQISLILLATKQINDQLKRNFSLTDYGQLDQSFMYNGWYNYNSCRYTQLCCWVTPYILYTVSGVTYEQRQALAISGYAR